jgi:DNA-binding MarR family transcriptional regulator
MDEQVASTGRPRIANPAQPTLLLRAFAEKTREFEKKIEELTAVNPTDRLVMEHLIQHGPQTPSELATAVGITPAAMTTSLDRLEELGHAHRAPHESDRRKLVVTPSEKSVGVIMSHLMAMVIDIDSITQEFTPEQMSAITNFLERVNAVYDEHLA